MGQQADNTKVETLDLDEMLSSLLFLTDAQWGLYAFSREPVRQKFSIPERIRLAQQAEECGRSFAGELNEKAAGRSMREYAEQMGITVEYLPIPGDGAQVLFAQFFPPNKIRIYDDCLNKAEQFLPVGNGIGINRREEIANILLSHELFHWLEEQNKNGIFTKQEKVQLWSIGPLKYSAPISCLGEIAAMAFTQELCGLSFSPYLLDVLLVYGYNPAAATNLYRGILRVAGNIALM